jgi:hypothetical protein
MLLTAPNFFTPPRLEPLHLDVVSLGGGGVSPTQFYGQTSDGRNVYCRYRGGWLSVHVSLEPGGDALGKGATLLEAGIGPGVHGSLSLCQLCRYAGITIAGQSPPMPSESEIAENGFRDLSGDTTFLDLWIESTEATALQLYDDIVNRIPDMIGAQQLQTSQRQYSICRTSADAIGWDLSLLRPVAPPLTTEGGWPIEIVDVEDVGRRMVLGIVQHGAYSPSFRPLIYSYSYDQRLTSPAGQPLQMMRAAGGLPVDNLSMRLSFPTGDARARNLATDIHRRVIERYPVERVLAFDLSNHERIPEKDSRRLLDPRIMEWVKGQEHRWLAAYTERNAGSVRYIGLRPE